MKEYEKDGEEISQYYLAGDQPVARKMYGYHGRKPQGQPIIQPTGLMTYYHYDGLGNVMDLTDTQGRDVAKFRYSAFGEVFAGIMSPYNYHGITGKEYDAKAGLMHYSSRWYDPSVGRFTQPDTYKGEIGQPQLSHPYVYVGNNPINRIDPTGHYTDPGGNYHDISDDEYEDIADDLGVSRDEDSPWKDIVDGMLDDMYNNGGGSDDTDDDDDDDGGSSGGGYNPPPRPAYEEAADLFNSEAPAVGSNISSNQASNEAKKALDFKIKLEMLKTGRTNGRTVGNDKVYLAWTGQSPITTVEKRAEDLSITIDYKAIAEAYEKGDHAAVDKLLRAIINGTQKLPGAKDKGVAGIIAEADGTYILGVNTSTGYFIDSKGGHVDTQTTSVLVKSNIEANVGSRIVVYPWMEKAEDVTGLGVTFGGEYALFESAGGGIEITNLSYKATSVSVQISPPSPSALPADAYFSVGYTSKRNSINLSPEEEAELYKKLNRIGPAL
ncbi:RHS repeat-associated core domain-containing protein [Anaerosolibacter sp.]|uniref:RHS repeat-associated core domain-containing protein n=1 Tax=Anaerosolibacter sp. TaxID=1872527 RepID=UPI0039F1299E